MPVVTTFCFRSHPFPFRGLQLDIRNACSDVQIVLCNCLGPPLSPQGVQPHYSSDWLTAQIHPDTPHGSVSLVVAAGLTVYSRAPSEPCNVLYVSRCINHRSRADSILYSDLDCGATSWRPSVWTCSHLRRLPMDTSHFDLLGCSGVGSTYFTTAEQDFRVALQAEVPSHRLGRSTGELPVYRVVLSPFSPQRFRFLSSARTD